MRAPPPCPVGGGSRLWNATNCFAYRRYVSRVFAATPRRNRSCSIRSRTSPIARLHGLATSPMDGLNPQRRSDEAAVPLNVAMSLSRATSGLPRSGFVQTDFCAIRCRSASSGAPRPPSLPSGRATMGFTECGSRWRDQSAGPQRLNRSGRPGWRARPAARGGRPAPAARPPAPPGGLLASWSSWGGPQAPRAWRPARPAGGPPQPPPLPTRLATPSNGAPTFLAPPRVIIGHVCLWYVQSRHRLGDGRLRRRQRWDVRVSRSARSAGPPRLSW